MIYLRKHFSLSRIFSWIFVYCDCANFFIQLPQENILLLHVVCNLKPLWFANYFCNWNTKMCFSCMHFFIRFPSIVTNVSIFTGKHFYHAWYLHEFSAIVILQIYSKIASKPISLFNEWSHDSPLIVVVRNVCHNCHKVIFSLA